MPNNPLPNPLPAGLDQNLKTLTPGTVVFVPDGEPRVPQEGDYFLSAGEITKHPGCGIMIKGFMPCYTRHVITAPVHIVNSEMLGAVVTALDCESAGPGLCIRCRDFIKRAFAHVLVPPQETGKTLEDRVCSLRDDAEKLGHPWSEIMQKWADLFEAVLQKTSDRLDAQQKSIDALRAELKEGRNGR